MQFKVISALAFATLVAAGAVRTSDNTNTNGNTNTPANTNGQNTDNGNNGNTDNGNTNNGNTNSGNTNGNIVPPFAGNPPPTISASKCPTGHLLCCKNAELPTASDVGPLLKGHNIDASDVSGYVGLACEAISLDNGQLSCSTQPACCTELYKDISLGCNKVNM